LPEGADVVSRISGNKAGLQPARERLFIAILFPKKTNLSGPITHCGWIHFFILS
jgi:hypothetical protein